MAEKTTEKAINDFLLSIFQSSAKGDLAAIGFGDAYQLSPTSFVLDVASGQRFRVQVKEVDQNEDWLHKAGRVGKRA